MEFPITKRDKIGGSENKNTPLNKNGEMTKKWSFLEISVIMACIAICKGVEEPLQRQKSNKNAKIKEISRVISKICRLIQEEHLGQLSSNSSNLQKPKFQEI